MGESPRGLDRVRAPDPARPRRRDLEGARALYSVDPDANPTSTVLVRCPRCEVERGLTTSELPGLLSVPILVDPFRGRLWTRCPTCERRAWLRIRLGPGVPWPFRPPRSG
ncbi:MAG: hypothetical protein KY462_01070 [Actinobacteria bacterium]|nr:hypothetical protein [Actinomycetota bacterium]